MFCDYWSTFPNGQNRSLCMHVRILIIKKNKAFRFIKRILVFMKNFRNINFRESAKREFALHKLVNWLKIRKTFWS